MCESAGLGLGAIADQDIGEAVLEPDLESQLVAIPSVLERNLEVEEKASALPDLNIRVKSKSRAAVCQWQEPALFGRSSGVLGPRRTGIFEVHGGTATRPFTSPECRRLW